MNYPNGTRGTVVRNGVLYYVEIKNAFDGQYYVESYAGLYFAGWIPKEHFTPRS